MPARPSSGSKLQGNFSELQARLSEAEDTLNAIRSGAVDALVVRTPRGEQLFTLKGADETYRALVEAMNEGAVTLKNDIISYCNNRFAEMVRMPLEKVFGASLYDLVPSEELSRLIRRLQKGVQTKGAIEASLHVTDGTHVPVFLSAARFYSDGQAAVGLVVTDITDRKEAERARQEMSRRILNAQEQERQRLARDLHDSVNQMLASAKYRLNSISAQSPNGARNREVHQVLHLVEKAIGEVKAISRNLRPSELDDLGLVPALRSLTQDFQERSGIPARFKGRIRASSSSLRGELDMTLYRIAQEALSNVERHSGASRAEVTLGATRADVMLTIYDNGKGFLVSAAPRRKGGWGLANMQERAHLLGGTLEIRSQRERGTKISVSIPFGDQTRASLGKSNDR